MIMSSRKFPLDLLPLSFIQQLRHLIFVQPDIWLILLSAQQEHRRNRIERVLAGSLQKRICAVHMGLFDTPEVRCEDLFGCPAAVAEIIHSATQNDTLDARLERRGLQDTGLDEDQRGGMCRTCRVPHDKNLVRVALCDVLHGIQQCITNIFDRIGELVCGCEAVVWDDGDEALPGKEGSERGVAKIIGMANTVAGDEPAAVDEEEERRPVGCISLSVGIVDIELLRYIYVNNELVGRKQQY